MREKELFDQLNLRFSSLQVTIGDYLQVKGDGSFWKRNADYPGRKLQVVLSQYPILVHME